jgi:hypothetical protein
MPEQRPSPDFVSLEDRAIQLRRAALQTRFRLAEQRAALEKIAASLNRAAGSVQAPKASSPPPPPLPRPVAATAPRVAAAPAPAVRAIAAPVAQQRRPVAVDKAERGSVHVPGPVATPAPTAFSVTMRTVPVLLPFLAIGAAAMVAHAKIAPRLAVVTPPSASAPAAPSGRDALVRLEPPAPAEDDGSAEALLLVHEWVPEGGDRSLLSLLGGELDRPGLPPSWTVERTGPRSFLVRLRDGAASHDFEADLESRSVRPAGETAALFAGR